MHAVVGSLSVSLVPAKHWYALHAPVDFSVVTAVPGGHCWQAVVALESWSTDPLGHTNNEHGPDWPKCTIPNPEPETEKMQTIISYIYNVSKATNHTQRKE